MKDKIIALIRNVRTIFTSRRTNMGSFPPHKPFVEQLAAEEKVLENAEGIIEQLDDTKATFAASSLLYMMESVVPVFRNWQARLKKIPATHSDVTGHKKANAEYQEMGIEILQLIADLDKAAQPALIADMSADTAEMGLAIIKAYDKEKYLNAHPIQEIKQTSMWSICRLQ